MCRIQCFYWLFAILERSTAMEPPRSRICTRQSVSTKRPSHGTNESQQAKKVCHENVTSKSKATTTGVFSLRSPGGALGSVV